MELLQTVGEGAGVASITVTCLAVPLTQDHLDRLGAGGGRRLVTAGLGVAGLTAGTLHAVASLPDVPAQLLPGRSQLVQTMGGVTVSPPAVASLQPDLAQLLGLPLLLAQLEVVLWDSPQFCLTCAVSVLRRLNIGKCKILMYLLYTNILTRLLENYSVRNPKVYQLLFPHLRLN